MGLSKGFDVEMGFHHKWSDLIMAGVSSVSYSVLVNGAPSGFIKPSRGICQRDPLSPYLFLLCTKGFSVLLRNVAHHRDLHGVSCSQNGPSITHLLFADDSLLFCIASLSECHIIKEILQAYELASRQKINSDKSSIFFSTNTPQSLREEIKRFFNANSNVPLEKYLGLPPIIGRGKKQAFEDIKSKVQSKLCGWKGGSHKILGPSHSDICHELLPSPFGSV